MTFIKLCQQLSLFTKITMLDSWLKSYLSKGKNYYWTWAYNHIGYDRYHEGVAILSKTPIEAREILVSDVDDPTDYHTRRVA